MKFLPVKQEYKKYQKGKSFLRIKKNFLNLKYGQIGLKAISSCRITSKQLIALYNGLRKKMKKKGKIIIRIFPQISITKKPTEARMGKGKGAFNSWVVKVFAGSIICEISTFYKNLGVNILNKAKFKLPLKTKIISRLI